MRIGQRYKKGCDSKRRFIHPIKAESFAKKFDPPLRIYPCKCCNGWHLTSQPELDSKTKSGKLIDKVISNLNGHLCIKTNLFNCSYIPKEDIEKHKLAWIDKYKPLDKDTIVLLGNRVHRLFPNNIPSILIKIKHPSSVWSKQAQEGYVLDVLRKITNNR